MAWFSQLIQSLGFVTQSAHFFAGWAVVLTLGVFFRPWRNFRASTLAVATFLCLWAIPKEMFFDDYMWGEGHGSPDWIDLLFYCLGTSVAFVVLRLKSR
jgi:hypothetical protein